ncbi:MAG: hypothetical protein IT210_18005 [Armatimonadetes bacterium]|nr:hypothetical protein [Armatimonadota bacterium]
MFRWNRWTYALGLAVLAGIPCRAAERKLAGVSIGQKALGILKIYGEPTRIELGERIAPQAPQPSRSAPLRQGGGPGPLPPVSRPGRMNITLSEPNKPAGMAPPTGGSGTLQPYPVNPPQLARPWTAQVPQDTKPQEQIIRWIYRKPEALLEFTLDRNGTVIQIRVVGAKWKGARTAKGVALNSSYRQVIARYGFPEVHYYEGGVLIAGYPNRHHAAFALVNKRVAAITVAMVE